MPLRITGHAAMRTLEALMLAWITWFVVDAVLLAGSEDPGATASAWMHFVKNGAWEFWEHLILVRDPAVRGGAWWLVLACFAVVSCNDHPGVSVCGDMYRVRTKTGTGEALHR